MADKPAAERIFDTGDDNMLDLLAKRLAELQAEEDKKKPKADSVREMRMAGLPVKRH